MNKLPSLKSGANVTQSQLTQSSQQTGGEEVKMPECGTNKPSAGAKTMRSSLGNGQTAK